MRIRIAQRLRPFSHCPGVRALLPGTDIRVRFYPTRLYLDRLGPGEPRLLGEIELLPHGVPDGLTVCQDLEKGLLRFWQHGSEGLERYELLARHDTVYLHQDKGGRQATSFVIAPPFSNSAVPFERLSLGSHKAQEWERMLRRRDLEAIFPLWLRLGQLTPIESTCSYTGTAALLQTIPSRAPEKMVEGFENVLRAGFEGMLSPRLIDTDYQGFDLPPPSPSESPLILLSEGAHLIRSLFIQQEGPRIALLPTLPPEFHCGRFLDIDCQGIATLHMEWTKKCLRRAIFRPAVEGDWQFVFQRDLRRFRLRCSTTDRGSIHSCDAPLVLESGKTYFLDCFEK